MRVLICPDKFAGTITATAAAVAIADGWHSAAPADRLEVRALADGGPGFLDVLSAAVGGIRLPVPTVDPLGRRTTGSVLLAHGTAYVESSQACGLHLVSEQERDPKATTSYGVGMLVAAAVALGAKQIVLGLGGSATNDGGAGMLTALGVRLVDQSGSELPAGALALTDIARLGGTPAIAGASVVAATDVNSPLLGQHGASVVYAEQKGARPEDLPMLDAALERLAAVLERDLPGCPSGFAEMPGAGSAGGLGAAVLALGGRNESGIGLVWRLTGLENALDEADVVITGEGSFDHQSLRGKVVGWVASAAKKRGLSCLVLAGRATVHRKEAAAAGITEVCSLADHFIGDMTAAMNRPSEGLRAMAAAAASRWRR